jgi:hypothetical protein
MYALTHDGDATARASVAQQRARSSGAKEKAEMGGAARKKEPTALMMKFPLKSTLPSKPERDDRPTGGRQRAKSLSCSRKIN